MSNILMTHEQADFDAIASLMGGFLLNRGSTPVLPRRINRNVRSFLDKYAAELPFVEAAEFSTPRIDAVTLVDTQSLVTIKGMHKKTAVHVVDHHRLRSNLPAEWAIFIHELGACSTIFVESIQENKLPLSVIQATLLLLGIYEDTGSMTFSRTEPRDVKAISFLLEQGASLQIANDYLYPPLSKEQRRVFDQLLRRSKTVEIQGCNIVLSKANAEQMIDEVSSTAHKLVDLLDPDALILTISTSEGIRLVARSNTNQIDVSRIVAHFGGGGHKRAAAALIRRDQVKPSDSELSALDHVYEELKLVLPNYVKEAIVIGQIMSSDPLVLKPEQTAQEAAKLMQRYGYEGYPVVENDKIVGLLTRRAVDRSLSHKLNLPIRSLMQAGNIWVKPSDNLEKLQQVMSGSDWGQVPVKNPTTNQIIGIVTRTDLIKTLAEGQTRIIQKTNLSSRLEKFLSPARLALLNGIAFLAHQQNLPLYIVGGFVRDLLLDRPSPDLDLVVEGNAIKLGRSIEKKFGGRVVSHKRFGTAKWQIAGIKEKLAAELFSRGKIDPEDFPDSIDLISARTEFYDYPTALPTVENSSIKLDLHRRDFAINTLALRLDNRHFGDLYDYWGGLNDLNHGYVRVLHSLSFVDDPTRMLRAVRFEQRFDFKIEARTLQLMSEAHTLIDDLSGDRLRHEFNLIFSEKAVIKIINRLNELKLLEAIHPELKWNRRLAESIEDILGELFDAKWELTQFFGDIPRKQGLIYLLWFANLKEIALPSLSKRLRLPHKLSVGLKQIKLIRDHHGELVNWKPNQLTELFDQVHPAVLFIIYSLEPSQRIKSVIDEYLQSWKKIQSFTDGHTLRQKGLKPGPEFRVILQKLRGAWLNGEINTKEQEFELLQQTLNDLSLQ